MIEVLYAALYYTLCILGSLAAFVAVVLLWSLGGAFFLGIERWHHRGEPWNLNIGLAVLWAVFFPCFMVCMLQHYSGKARSVTDTIEGWAPDAR